VPGAAAIQAEIGAQISHLVGLYVINGVGTFFNTEGGALSFEAALVLDFTLKNVFSFGLGPDAGLILPGYCYGGRLRLAAYPAQRRGEDGIRRRAFTIGVDLRILSVTIEFMFDQSETFAAVIPTLFIGYTAF
jgi:hypothetical protein